MMMGFGTEDGCPPITLKVGNGLFNSMMIMIPQRLVFRIKRLE